MRTSQDGQSNSWTKRTKEYTTSNRERIVEKQDLMSFHITDNALSERLGRLHDCII